MATTVTKTTKTTAGAVTRCTIRTVRIGNRVTVTRKCSTVNTKKGK